MAKFRKKPVVVEAVQYGPHSMPTVELAQFLEGVHCSIGSEGLVIETLEGNMLASLGDWIIKGVNGEYYPCKPDIFEKTYESASLCDQDTDSTETADEGWGGEVSAELIEPMADLSGEESKVDWQTGLIKPEVMNGTLSPETD